MPIPPPPKKKAKMKDLYFDLKKFKPTNYSITFFYSKSWCGKLNNIIINCILLKKNWWPSKFIQFPNLDAHTQKKCKKKKKKTIILICWEKLNNIINCLLFFGWNRWPSKFIQFPKWDTHTQKKKKAKKQKKRTSILIWKKSKNTSYSTVFLSLWCGRLNNSIINCLLFFSFFWNCWPSKFIQFPIPEVHTPKKCEKKKDLHFNLKKSKTTNYSTNFFVTILM